eukprot:1370666-Alexandrium_andersonii.AAC.1
MDRVPGLQHRCQASGAPREWHARLKSPHWCCRVLLAGRIRVPTVGPRSPWATTSDRASS